MSSNGDASSDNDPRRRSKKIVSNHEDSHEIETIAELKSDAPSRRVAPNATSSASAPPSSTLPPDAKRKRSSFLLQSMHPEGARESAAFVDKLPGPTTIRVLFVLFAYALLLSDVPRGGSCIDTLPYVQFEPNVFAVYGPTTLSGRTVFRNGTTVSDDSSVASEISTAFYKFAPSSYGLRTSRDLLDATSLEAAWPTCLLSSRYPESWYSADCSDTLPGTTVFDMLDTLVDALAANAASTTSYKNVAQTEDGIAIMARGELSSFPQRVCFAARAKARWSGTSGAGSGVSAASSSTSFLSRNLIDHKYWLSVWATAFADLDPSNPGVDLCVDDLDRPLFCEKPWAAAQNPDGSPSENAPLWEAVSSRVAELQAGLAKGEKLDITLVETESDPLTRLGGAVLLAHKIYNVVVIYRIRECTSAGVCATKSLRDERVEGKVLYTDALEWSSLAATLRYIGQVYITIRLACLLLACYAAVDQTTVQQTNPNATPHTVNFTQRIKRAARIFFAVPTQVIVYGSWITVLCYASAHIIDVLINYELEDNSADSATDSLSSLAQWLAIHMRSVWLMAILARFRALLQTSAGAWTPGHGVSGVRGHLLPTLALGAVLFVMRGGISLDDRDARILEANEVEPVPTFMLLRAETLDAWKMNLEGAYSDMLSLALAAVIYVFAILAMRALLRWYRRRAIKPTTASQGKGRDRSDAVPEPLFFAHSAVPSAAGALWEPSCLSVSWDDDLFMPLLDVLSSPNSWMNRLSSSQVQEANEGDADASFSRGGDGTVTSSASSTQRMLMNLVFLSDPWNLLVLKLGRARVHLFHLHSAQLDCKVVHAQTKARVAREYSLGLELVELVASLRASELSWGQLITCK